MSHKFLTPIARSSLLTRHRRERDRRVADRIKVVLLRDDGWSYASIAEALFLSEEGVRQQLKDYAESEGKKLKPENGGSDPFLNEAHTKALIAPNTQFLRCQGYMQRYRRDFFGAFFIITKRASFDNQAVNFMYLPAKLPNGKTGFDTVEPDVFADILVLSVVLHHAPPDFGCFAWL